MNERALAAEVPYRRAGEVKLGQFRELSKVVDTDEGPEQAARVDLDVFFAEISADLPK